MECMMRQRWVNILEYCVVLAVLAQMPGCSASAGTPAPTPARLTTPSLPVKVTTFPHNKTAAVSITFDDSVDSQVQVALPILRSFHLPATFFVIAGHINDTVPTTGAYHTTWAEWKQAQQDGYEVGNHSMDHKQPLVQITDDATLDWEINGAAQLIQDKTGIAPLTFAFPWTQTNARTTAVALQRHIKVRTENSYVYDNTLTVTQANAFIDTFLAKGMWGVTMNHGFEGNGYKPVSRVDFTAHCAYINSKRDQLWVDTYANMARYIAERKVAVVKTGINGNPWCFSVSTPLDAHIYNIPLTLSIPVPAGHDSRTLQLVRDDTHTPVSLQLVNGTLLTDVVPGAATYTLVDTAQLSAVTLTPSSLSPCDAGKVVTLTAVATGGANVVYSFLVNGAVVRDYAAKATYDWTPDIAGTYTLLAQAKDLAGANPAVELHAALSPYTVVAVASLTATPAKTCTLGTAVTLSAKSSGLKNPVYRFSIGTLQAKGHWNWQNLTGFDTASTVTWKPLAAGPYTLVACVRGSASTQPYDLLTDIPYMVTPR